jgi:hypothetical protein
LSFRFRFLAVAIAVACGVLIGFPSWAGAQCVDEALKEQLIGKRAYRGVVPRLFKKALRPPAMVAPVASGSYAPPEEKMRRFMADLQSRGLW